jgi:nitrogen fixation/metabolism regulation signal transduction histidine kinase
VGGLVLELSGAVEVRPAADAAAAAVRLWLLPPGASTWVGDGHGGSPEPGSWPRSAGGPIAGPAGWLAQEQEATIPGWRVAGAVSRSADDELLAAVRNRLLGAGLLAVFLAAAGGLWAARPLGVRVRELLRSVSSVRAGEADYTFPAGGGDELDALVARFSALQRDLERQRDRGLAAERVAAWSEVARRVAHEVKNPLAPIRLTVQNLQRARAQGRARFDELFDDGSRTILEEVDQLSRLVSEFSEFARLPAPELHSTDIVSVVRGALELFAAEPELEIEATYPDRPLILPADAEQLGRALKNVVGNAVDALRELPAGRPRVLRVEVADADAGAVIRVADSGPGFSTDTPARIFEPYFTTKPGGTGLGMAITYRIITEHGGEIRLASRPGEGACVTIRLTDGENGHAARADRG